MANFRFLMIFATLLLTSGFFIRDSFAYIDPGSGSLVIQMLIGVLVGVGVTLKVYWAKIKFKFATLKKDE